MKTKKFERPMFRYNGFFYPIPDNINIRWMGSNQAEGSRYVADKIKEKYALRSLMDGAQVRVNLNDTNWDKIVDYAVSILPCGFGFTIINYEVMQKYYSDKIEEEKA